MHGKLQNKLLWLSIRPHLTIFFRFLPSSPFTTCPLFRHTFTSYYIWYSFRLQKDEPVAATTFRLSTPESFFGVKTTLWTRGHNTLCLSAPFVSCWRTDYRTHRGYVFNGFRWVLALHPIRGGVSARGQSKKKTLHQACWINEHQKINSCVKSKKYVPTNTTLSWGPNTGHNSWLDPRPAALPTLLPWLGTEVHQGQGDQEQTLKSMAAEKI